MIKKTIEMGQYGYLKDFRKKKMIIFTILLLIILLDIVVTYCIYKTTKHYLIVIAVLFSLPLAKVLIALITTRTHNSLTSDDYNKINKYSQSKSLNTLYDISITLYEGIRFYQAITIYNQNIIALVLHKDKLVHIVSYKTQLEKSICKDKYKYNITVVQNIDDYILKVQELEEVDHDISLIDDFLRNELLVFGSR